ncbi:hypothetical protein GCM10012275_54230 [Longimycelium tulufanense]|uniref:Uncharacterized protein n=1 Tax=Longimycelium tulufanense TaxID=907463 RepID=A0A8J3FXT8_9PSEU|nr:hypothetical protein [Longimycelium tulufanense]GGM76662.1 hypothetical protein GCM10012275_54230 [Longimycelium tulufanense]
MAFRAYWAVLVVVMGFLKGVFVRNRLRAVGALATAVVVATLSAPSFAFAANARGEVPAAEQVKAVAASAAAAAGQQAATQPREGIRVTLPDENSRKITLGTGEGLPQITLALPETPGDHAGTSVSGTKVFRAQDKKFAVVAEPVADGARSLVTIHGDAAPTRYDFNVELPHGVQAAQQDDGSVVLAATQDGVRLELGRIQAPWARDAAGKKVPTHYEVKGNTLTQVVDHHGAAYPVVADPKLTYGWGVYLNGFGTEWRALYYAAGGLIAGGIGAVCIASNIPAPAAALIKLACFIGGGKTAWGVLEGVHKKAQSLNPGQCYQMKLDKGAPLVPVEPKNCIPGV